MISRMDTDTLAFLMTISWIVKGSRPSPVEIEREYRAAHRLISEYRRREAQAKADRKQPDK